MRTSLVAFALVALSGCGGSAYRTGLGSTGAQRSEPDPFVLLGRDIPIGVRLDLAASICSCSATPTPQRG